MTGEQPSVPQGFSIGAGDCRLALLSAPQSVSMP
jgi:hypothetical protein